MRQIRPGGVVANVKRPVRPDSQPRWPVLRAACSVLACKAVGENHVLAGRLAVSERLKHDIVAGLWT